MTDAAPAEQEPAEGVPAEGAPQDLAQQSPLPQVDLPGTPDAEGWRRLHPLSPVLRGGLFLVVLVGIIIANFRDRVVQLFVDSGGGSGDGDDDYGQPGDIVDLYEFLVESKLLLIALGGLLGIILLIVLFAWIGWRFHTFRVTAEAVESRKGVLFRQHRRAPLDRVQSINLQRSLLARIFGLTRIDVLTGGQGGKVELSYIGHRDAKTVREQILRLAAAKRDGKSLAESVDLDAPSAAVSSAAVAYDGAASASPTDLITERAQDFVDFDVDPEATASNSLIRVPVGRLLGSIALSWEVFTLVFLVLAALTGGTIMAFLGIMQQDGLGTGLGATALFSIIPIILVLISVVFSMFNKGFKFTLSRGRDSVRVGAGLTSTITDSIPFGRVHAIEARQPLFWRPFGWWKLRVTLAGHSAAEAGQNGMQNVVLPVGTSDDAVRVIETLIPGTSAGIAEGLNGDGAGYLRAGRKAGWVLWFGKRRAGIRIDVPEHAAAPGETTEVGAEAEVKAPAPNEATLRIRRGFLTRSLTVMPVVRAQSVQLSRPMVHYWLGLAKINAHTVLGPVRMEISGIDHAQAEQLFADLSAAMLQAQLAESHEGAESHDGTAAEENTEAQA